MINMRCVWAINAPNQQNLRPAAGGLFGHQARGDDAGIIEYQQGSWRQQPWKITKTGVIGLTGGNMQSKQPRCVANRRRGDRNAVAG
jgi:hypothetical protein